jgi:hypothetical protein
MNARVISVVLVLGIAALGYFAWTKNQERQAAQAPLQESGEAGGMPQGMGGMGGEIAPPTSTDAGIEWTAPKNWTVEAPRSMRLATYSIPAAAGDAEDATCAVYYFGAGQGGGVDANIQRWTGEFQDAKNTKRSDMTVSGLKISQVSAQGAYLSHGGGGMGAAPEAAGSKSDYALLGAIVEGPNGSVFFKLTGPVKTVRAAEKDFGGMLKSMRKT